MDSLILHEDGKTRCVWCGTDPLYTQYHDTIWGVADHDSQSLFAKLMLDGQQAGLSWITILRKEAAYRDIFQNFDPHYCAHRSDADLESILQDPRIVRNRLKVYGIRRNARVYLELEKTHSFADLLWSFAPRQKGILQTMEDYKATSAESDAMSLALKKAGMTFVGSTICYAFMQAVGMVNDHLTGCFRQEELA